MRLYIIGAGGVAGYLLPPLFNTFRDKITKVFMWDKDTVEERNLLRQMFSVDQVGQSKASALAENFGGLLGKTPFRVFNDWFQESWVFQRGDTPTPDDWIICIADNHRARRDAIAASINYGCGVILGGNEYISAQAYVYHPIIADLDPRTRYDLSSDEGSPFRCNTEAALSAFPQLAMANAICATFIVQLLFAWETIPWKTEAENLNYLPIEFNSNEYGHTRTLVSDARRR